MKCLFLCNATTIEGGSNGAGGGVVGYATGGEIKGGGSKGTISGKYAGGAVGYSSGNIGNLAINVNITATSVTGTSATGGVLGYGSASIYTTSVDKVALSGGNPGGIVGDVANKEIFLGSSSITIKCSGASGLITYQNTGTITGDSSKVTITASKKADETEQSVPLVNENKGSLAYIKASGKILPSAGSFGFIAITNSSGAKISYCENSVSYEGTKTSVGGIVGTNSGVLHTCKNTASLKGSIDNLGGIAGINNSGATIFACINDANIESSKSSADIGGIVGENKGNIGESENKKDVISTSSTKKHADYGQSIFSKDSSSPSAYVGGIAGYTNGGTTEGSNSGSISNAVSHSSSSSSASITDYRGQISGYKTSSGTVTNLGTHRSFTKTGTAPYIEVSDSVEYGVLYIRPTEFSWDWGEDYEASGNFVMLYKDYSQNPMRDNGPLDVTEKNKDGCVAIKDEATGFTSSSYHSGESTLNNYVVDLIQDLESSSPWTDRWSAGGSWGDDSAFAYKSVSSSTTAVSQALWFTQEYTRFKRDQYQVNGTIKVIAFAQDQAGDNAIGVLFVFPFSSYSWTEDTQAGSTTGLQDCGGSVTTYSGDTQNGTQLEALVKLYVCCGDCEDSSSSVSDPGDVDALTGAKSKSGDPGSAPAIPSS